jgi:hypothetical protein
LLAGAYSFKTEKIARNNKEKIDSFLKDKFIYVFGALTRSNYRDDIHKIKLDRKD